VRIELTLDLPGGSPDVVLTAPETGSLADVMPALARAVGARADLALWAGDRALPASASLAEAALRTGAIVSVGRPGPAGVRPGVLSLHIVGGPNAGVVTALERGELSIGRDTDCDVVLADADVSRRQARIEVRGTSITVHDLGSTNGTFVDGHRVGPGGVPLRPGCLISIGDSLLTVAGPSEAPATVQPGGDGTVLVLRPPRGAAQAIEREIVLPTRSTAARPRGVQWVTALLPAAAGAAIAWFSHSPQFLLFALLSPVMMISTSLGDRVHWRRSRRRDAATFKRRRAEADQQVAEALESETLQRRSASPDPAALLRLASLPSSRLWERRRGAADLLSLRVGTADLPSTLRARAGNGSAPAGTLGAVPLCVDLRRGPLGVAGPAKIADGLARWLVAQLAALHSPIDVELALLLSPGASVGWAWSRWLPHLRGRVAVTEGEWTALVAELASTVDQRHASQVRDPAGWQGPWLVLVVDRAAQLAEVPGLTALVARGSAVGLSAICIDADVGGLPTFCASVARVDGETGTRLALRTQSQPAAGVAVIDQVSPEWAARVARSLAPLVDAGRAGSVMLPDRCRLLEVLDLNEPEPARITARWAASTGGAQAVLGVTGDGPFTVDLVADGPHALVAGTTGSGKSELLQTLVVGLATNHPPDEINFLLVDYKGGAAFADCARLPHTAGLVTDLDPYLTERALRSLNSELRRRERCFADAAVADLVAYRAARVREPIPRLVIVVDEFASLAEELPDFVRGVIGVAQRGRSLGVHLVLATQRPGSAVSAEIRANTSLRIALRVTDPGESSDVIDAPDAALIGRSNPGRAYARVGGALLGFQSAHAAGISTADPTEVIVERLGPWRRSADPELGQHGERDIARLVDAIRQTAETSGRASARSPWLPPLPDQLPRSALGPSGSATSVALARIDLPDEQRNDALDIDLSPGTSVLASGAAHSGRTGLLSSLAVGAATQLPPDRLQLYVIDAAGALGSAVARLPHAATVLGPDELALSPRLLHCIERECARRIADRAGRRAEWARLLLLVDGWETIAASLADVDAADCSDAVAGLLRVGPAAGLSIALAGDRSTLTPRFAAGFSSRILLRLPDRTDYGLAGIATRDVPAELPPGRGLRAGDGAVLQIAHAGSAPTPEDVEDAADVVARAWASTGHGGLSPEAIRIRPLPARVGLADVASDTGRLTVGLAGDQGQPMAIDPFDGAARVLVAGPPRSGRTTVLRLLAQQAHEAGIATIVAATSRSALAETSRELSLPLIGPADSDVGPAPAMRTLLLVDDSERFVDSPAGDQLTRWVRESGAPLAAIVAGRADDLATTYRGIAAEVRRHHCGILLRPGPIDGELLGVRLPRRPSSGPPGRGVVVGDPAWGPPFDDGEPVPIQVAVP
jgi:S-DNA-T family DNA segregation ATPase FtsK/SpoIIIE